MITCFINSLRKFTKMLPKTSQKFSLRCAILLTTVGFICKAILDPEMPSRKKVPNNLFKNSDQRQPYADVLQQRCS